MTLRLLMITQLKKVTLSFSRSFFTVSLVLALTGICIRFQRLHPFFCKDKSFKKANTLTRLIKLGRITLVLWLGCKLIRVKCCERVMFELKLTFFYFILLIARFSTSILPAKIPAKIESLVAFTNLEASTQPDVTFSACLCWQSLAKVPRCFWLCLQLVIQCIRCCPDAPIVSCACSQ